MTARKTTPCLHIDPATGATVLDAKAPAKKTALTDAKLSLRVVAPKTEKKATPVKNAAAVKVTMAQRVRDQFEAGASLTEASKAAGADPAYTWDLAKIWTEKTGRMVPRNGRAPKVAATEKAEASS